MPSPDMLEDERHVEQSCVIPVTPADARLEKHWLANLEPHEWPHQDGRAAYQPLSDPKHMSDQHYHMSLCVCGRLLDQYYCRNTSLCPVLNLMNGGILSGSGCLASLCLSSFSKPGPPQFLATMQFPQYLFNKFPLCSHQSDPISVSHA